MASHNASVVSSTGTVGGIVGMCQDTITASFNTGSVSGIGFTSIGGIVGVSLSGSTVSNSYNTGTISGFQAGGVAGNLQGGGAVSNSFNTGHVSGSGLFSSQGGLVGSNGVSGWNNTDIVSNSVSLGSQVAITEEPGGWRNRIAGQNFGNATLENNRARSDMLLVFPHQTVTVTDGEHDNPNGADITPGITPMSEVFAGWDPAIWDIPGGILTVGGPLPTLRNVAWEQNPTLPAVEESQE